MLAATLASFSETQQVLAEQGNQLDRKTIRLVAYRAAERARLAQKMGGKPGDLILLMGDRFRRT